MKTYKRLSAAKKAANGLPLIRVGSGKNAIFLVPEGEDLVGLKLTEVSLISPEGRVAGHITMGHLNRLGNGNWASPGDKGWYADCFPKDGEEQVGEAGACNDRGSPEENKRRTADLKVGDKCYWKAWPKNLKGEVAAIETDEDGDVWVHLSFSTHKDMRVELDEVVPL